MKTCIYVLLETQSLCNYQVQRVTDLKAMGITIKANGWVYNRRGIEVDCETHQKMTFLEIGSGLETPEYGPDRWMVG